MRRHETGRKPGNSSTVPPAQSICIDCGLCCDGTLFARTTVRKADEPVVAAIDLPVVEWNGKKVFEQPCRHFACGRCKVYAMRPAVCERFRCALLQTVDEGDISCGEAREKIAKAKELVSAVRRIKSDAVTPAQRTELSNNLREKLQFSDNTQRRKIAAMLLDVGALDLFLARWFHKKPSDHPTDGNGIDRD